jgi:hypothetical protein
MKLYLYTIFICLNLILFAACRSEITEDKVRKAAGSSNEINHEYIQNRRETYVKTLEKRIETLEKDLGKMRDVSDEGKKGSDIETAVQQIAAEKALLEGSLRMLHEKTELAEKQMDKNFNSYNQSLDSTLKDINAFLETYKMEK